MKIRNTYLVTLLLAICTLSCVKPSGIANELYTINQHEINISFTTKYTFDDLANVKYSLDSFGIVIIYDSLKFNDSGYLKQISATIRYPDGKRGSFASRELKDIDSPGFRHKF